MSMELRTVLAAVCFFLSAVFILIALLGVFRFHFVMNRMHCAAVIDSLGLGFLFAGLILYTMDLNYIPKLLLLLVFWWVGSPIAAHMAGRIEIETDPEADAHIRHIDDLDSQKTADSKGNAHELH